MANKDYYASLGVNKNATEADIKKAYKKKAMEYHPDKNQWDKKAEAKFKEINEAYQTLWDSSKRKSYDQFGSAEWNPFGGGMGWNPFGGGQYRSSGQSGGYEDIFSQFGGMGWQQAGGFEFDIGDLFGGGRKQSKRSEPKHEEPKKEIVNLDVTETIEIPFFDFLYDTSVSVKTVYNKVLTLKVKAGTKPGTKFKISGKWRSADGKTGDMFVIVDAKMPKLPLDTTVEKMIEAIRYQI
jgi:DnaJ-class molecular chaperone